MTKALIFDCDGVLADTERDGHLVAFNRMWREQGVNWQWSLAQYAEKVKIGGGDGLVKFMAAPGLAGKHRAAQITEVAYDSEAAGGPGRSGERFRR